MVLLRKYNLFADLEKIENKKIVDPVLISAACYSQYRPLTTIVQPENVTRNRDFFDALNQVGLRPMGWTMTPKHAPHQRRFYLLADTLCLIGNKGPVIGFLVPEMGAQHLHTKVLKDSCCMQKDNIVGRGGHTIIRAREKLDGVECVIFGVKYYNDVIVYYLWDDVGIKMVKATEPCLLEKVGDKYYVLSDTSDDASFGIDVEPHPWRTLDRELLDTCTEGIIVDVDLEQYKVPRDLTVTLRVNGETLEDASGNVHFPTPRPLDNGIMVDVTVKGDMVKSRPDRVYPDSRQQIDVITRCAATISDVKQTLPLEGTGVGVDSSRLRIQSVLKTGVVSLFYEDKSVVPVTHYESPIKSNDKRSDFIRTYMKRCQEKGEKSVKISDMWRTMYANFLFPKDGKLLKLQYRVGIPYDADGISNYPKDGYSALLTTTSRVSVQVAHFFLYKGYALLFYDRSKYRLKQQELFDNILVDEEIEPEEKGA